MRKEYIFRHWRCIWALKVSTTEQELKDKLKEDQLSKGYLPVNIRVQTVVCNDTKPNGVPFFNEAIIGYPKDWLYVDCISSYFGKKAAREQYDTINKIHIENEGSIHIA